MDFRSTNIVYILLALIISITLHEAMHAYTAHWLGDDTAHGAGRISLNPLRHVDPYLTIVLPAVTLLLFGVPLLAAKPVPFNPNRVKFDEFGAALVGIAGPATNLVLALVTGLFLRGVGANLGGGIYNFLYVFAQLNVALFVFNMIPIPPLDGSRLLYAFAPETIQEFMQRLEPIGIFIVFGLVIAVPVFTNLLINVNETILRIVI